MKNASHLLLAAALVLALGACGDDDNPVNPADRVCGAESGFGARMQGTANPVDVCVSNDKASVVFTAENRYLITAIMSKGDVIYQFDFEVPHRDDTPVVLTLYSDRGVAAVDPSGVWLRYQEAPDGETAVESFEITGGTFTLSFSATDVMTATFSDVTMRIQTQEGTPQDRGTRGIEKGFMSLSVDT
jgi:hypothetical protein